MSGMDKYPVENTIAFGGVATGNMKAKEQATVAAIIRKSGCIPRVIPYKHKCKQYTRRVTNDSTNRW